jgi:septum formation protein
LQAPLQAARPELILASGSAARAGLLRGAGLVFSVRPAAIDEAAVKAAARAEDATPDETALLLADLKAARVAAAVPDALVIGADQLLVCDGRWFDKPADLTEARAHLNALRGRAHVLVTAMVLRRGGARVFQHVSRPRLTMRAFGDAFLDAFLGIEGEAVLDSVGAYRLEGLGIHLFEAIEGEQSAVLGLALLPLLGFLRQHAVLLD